LLKGRSSAPNKAVLSEEVQGSSKPQPTTRIHPVLEEHLRFEACFDSVEGLVQIMCIQKVTRQLGSVATCPVRPMLLT
jgi:hypothetical protein